MISSNGTTRDSKVSSESGHHLSGSTHSPMEGRDRRRSLRGDADELNDKCIEFRNGVKVKDHRYRSRTYKNTFVGSEAVTFLVVSGMASSRAEAVELGRKFATELHLFEHVTREHEFKDERLFYRFGSVNSSRSDRRLARAAPAQRHLETVNLSYTEMCFARDGKVLRRDQIKEKRIHLGYCPTCPGEPVRLFDIQRSKINPLSRKNQPLTVEGECLNGQCLVCHPELGPKKRKKKKRRDKSQRLREDDQNFVASNASTDFSELSNGAPSSSSSRLERFLGTGGENDQSGTNLSGSHDSRRVAPSSPSQSGELNSSFGGNDNSDNRNHDENGSERLTKRFSGSCGQFRNLVSVDESPPDSPDRSTRRASMPSGQVTSTNSPSENGSPTHTNGDVGRTTGRDSSGGASPPPAPRRLSSPGSGAPRRCTVAVDSSENNDFNHINSHTEEAAARLPEITVEHNDPLETAYAEYRKESIGRPVRTVRGTSFSSSDQEPTESSVTSLPAQNVDATVRDLEGLVREMMTSGDSDFIVDVLVSSMKSHPRVEKVQMFCLGAFFDLFKNNNRNRDANKASTMSSSAPDDILLAMKNLVASPKVQEAGCRVLWSLSLDKNNRMVLSRAGAVVRILRAVKEHENNETVVQTAIGALRTLSPEPEIRADLRELKGNEIVAHAMTVHRFVEAIQRDGIAFLSNAAVDIQNQHVAVASFVELDAIVQAMAAHPTSDLVVSGACFALKNYVFEEKNAETLRRCDKVVSLLANAANSAEKEDRRRNANVVIDKLEMLHAKEESLEQSLSQVRVTRSNMGDPDCNLGEILRVLRDYDASVEMTASALQSLLDLASQRECRRRIIDQRVMNVIVNAMKNHDTCSKVQEQGCGVLERLAGDGHESRNEIILCGGCGAIAAAMELYRDDAVVLSAAFKALKCLSVEFECWFELEKSGGVRTIEEVMGTHMDVSTLQQEGTEILTNFSAHSI